jgi:phospholipid-translocating ATPase
MKISPRSKLFLKRRKEQDDDNDSDKLKRTESTSSYMQKRRNIYVNMELPSSEFDDNGKQIKHHYASNRVRTAKYTPLTYIPKNLFEQFRNVANLYFLFIVILQCIPLFGVAEPAVSALPLICILIITGIKDGIEDLKRHQSDNRVNNSKTMRLSDWKNVNVPEVKIGTWYFLHVIIGFFSVLSGAENNYTASYRHSKKKKSIQNQSASQQPYQPQPPTEDEPKSSEDKVPLNEEEGPSQPQKTFISSVRKRSDTIRSLSNIFKPNHSNSSLTNNKPYRPGAIPHSVLYRVSSTQSNSPAVGAGTPGVGKQESLQPRPTPLSTTISRADIDNSNNDNDNDNDNDSTSTWERVKWKDIGVGDYVLVKNDDEIPADIVILSTSETDNVCFVETQNLDGETNLKQRQGLPGTVGIRTEDDCENASFYIESEPPNVNLYQYNAVLRWQIDATDTATMRSGVSHEKADAVTYNNIMLRGCVLRNTKWAIGIVVYTGDDTKIMMNSGRTPSKRSKLQKASTPHVSISYLYKSISRFFFSILPF